MGFHAVFTLTYRFCKITVMVVTAAVIYTTELSYKSYTYPTVRTWENCHRLGVCVIVPGETVTKLITPTIIRLAMRCWLLLRLTLRR